LFIGALFLSPFSFSHRGGEATFLDPPTPSMVREPEQAGALAKGVLDVPDEVDFLKIDFVVVYEQIKYYYKVLFF
jgi:hypothetical protein